MPKFETILEPVVVNDMLLSTPLALSNQQIRAILALLAADIPNGVAIVGYDSDSNRFFTASVVVVPP